MMVQKITVLAPKKILLTGATGFLGKHLLPRLHSHSVTLLSRNTDLSSGGHEQVKIDLQDFIGLESYLKNNSFDYLIHLAWMGIPNYSQELSDLNFKVTSALLDLAIKSDINKIISIGSCWEYGKLRGSVKEFQEGQELPAFAAAKLEIAKKYFCQNNGLDFKANWLRLFYVFGKNQRPNSIIPTIMSNLNNNVFDFIKNPFEVRDYIYVEDVVNVILEIINNDLSCGILNVSSNTLKSPLDIHNDILELTRKKKPILKINDNFLINKADLSKFFSHFPNFKFTDFKTGLEKSIM
jgi:nucleoside-diphosphate-sugar epimerase